MMICCRSAMLLISGVHIVASILRTSSVGTAVSLIQFGSKMLPGETSGSSFLRLRFASSANESKVPEDNEAKQWLRLHNIARCMHGAPPVTWSPEVAFDAHEYIHHMTAMVHSDSFGLAPPAGPAGENLYLNTAQVTPELAVNAWYDEVYDCQGGLAAFTDGCAVGANGKPTGHFTVMVWSTVTFIGCATNEMGTIAICRYKAGDALSIDTPNMNKDQGNYVGHVSPRVQTAEACADSGTPRTVRGEEAEPISAAARLVAQEEEAAPSVQNAVQASSNSAAARVESQLEEAAADAQNAARVAQVEAQREVARAENAAQVAEKATEAAGVLNDMKRETGYGDFSAAAANAQNAAAVAQSEAQAAAQRAQMAAQVAGRASQAADALNALSTPAL